MSVAIVTGASGLIGGETVRFLHGKGLEVHGIDAELRSRFVGPDGAVSGRGEALQRALPGFSHHALDVRDGPGVERLFRRLGRRTVLVVHAAAQPSHDWAASEPSTDFTVNANGTLVLLEATRRHCPQATFVFTSTNKVYGDTPNRLPLVEQEKRWEVDPSHPYAACGIDESMSIDASLHSLFGVSKAAADLLCQEYARYFGLKTAVFRAGCVTGPGQAAGEQHGFLAYLVKCLVTGRPYTIFGHGGKQVRDHIHAADLVEAFWHFHRGSRRGEVYNIGGSRHSHVSILEVIELLEELSGSALDYTVSDEARPGDHRWWVSDVRRFRSHHPEWLYHYDLKTVLRELVDAASGRS